MPCGLSKSELEQRRIRIQNIIFKNKLRSFEEQTKRVNEMIFLDFKVTQAQEILRSAYEIFEGKMAVAFSGGKDSLVALHLTLHTIGSEIPVIFSNTTVEFPETVLYVHNIAESWNLNLEIPKPPKSFFETTRERGWASHENRWCCRPYKEEPALKFMKESGIIAEITGTTRTESIYRRSLTPIKMPQKEPFLIRINPIYDWNQWEVWKYISWKNLPYNPLYDMGYRRIGCWCCPLNGPSHYLKLKKTHPKLFQFLEKFNPKHPYFKR